MNHITRTMLNKINIPHANILEKGNIVYGKIINQENEQTRIQIRNHLYRVMLPKDITNIKEGYFKVENADEPIQLSLFSSDIAHSGKSNTPTIHTQAARTDIMKELVNKLNISSGEKPNAAVLSYMVKQDLPMSEATYNALNRVWERPFQTTTLLNELQGAFNQLTEQSPVGEKLVRLLTTINNHENHTIAENIMEKLNQPSEKMIYSQLVNILKDNQHLAIFNSRKTVQPILNMLQKFISGEQVNDNTLTDDLKIYLSQLVQQEKLAWSPKQTLQMLQQLTDKLGKLNCSESLEKYVQTDLQLLLRQYVKESKFNHPINKTVEALLEIIVAQQLLSSHSGQMISLFYQLPIQLFDWQTNLTLHWESKKNEKGQIDASYCTVVFHLHMQKLGETLVRMHVQNHHISLKIYTAHPYVKEIAQPLLTYTKNNLKEVGYHLGTVEFLTIDEHKETVQQYIRPRHIQERKRGIDRLI